MLALDVNVLVTALRPDRRDHLAMKEWVEGAVADPEPVGVSDAVLAGAVRVPTHRRVFDPPSAVDDVLTEPSRLRGADDGDFAQFPGLVWRRTLRA